MPSVFLSYSHEDLPLIEPLEAQLKSYPDISIWRDQEKIYGGQKWPKDLGEAIADQDMFLLAWSKNSAASHFVEFEWCTAIALKKTIVPCLLDSTSLPPSLTATNAISIDNLSKLIAALTANPLIADVARRVEIISKLDQVMDTEPREVLKTTKTLFDQQGWMVQGNMIHAKTVRITHYHSEPRASVSPAYERYLNGEVLLIQDNNELEPGSEVKITLKQTADTVLTGQEGLFKLSLPETCRPGIRVELSARKEGWVLYTPQDGGVVIPALNTELTKLQLIKKDSWKLWSDERIESYIQERIIRFTNRVRLEGSS